MALGSWKGFKRTVKHNNKKIEVKVNETAANVKKNVQCSHCSKRVKSNGNLVNHLQFKHLEEQENQENLSYDLASNSSTTRDRTKAIVRSVVEKLVSDVVGKVERASPAEDCVIVEDKPKAKSNRKGQNRRNKYTAQFKATVIEKMMPDVFQEHLVEEYNVSQSNISKWLKNKDKIFKEAADSNRKTLTKMRVGTKYVRLYSELLTEVRKARSRGYLVNFNWIWTKARKTTLTRMSVSIPSQHSYADTTFG